MTDEKHDSEQRDEVSSDLSRRNFIAMSVAAGIAALLEAGRGVTASPASLSRLLCRAGFTYKKNASGGGARTRRRERGADLLDLTPIALYADNAASPCLC